VTKKKFYQTETRLSATFSFFVTKDDAGGRPRFFGTVVVGVAAALSDPEAGVSDEAVEADVGGVGAVEGASLGVVLTAPGLNEKRTDFRGNEPPDFSAGGLRIGFVGEFVSAF
jgi:hypothetical protein